MASGPLGNGDFVSVDSIPDAELPSEMRGNTIPAESSDDLLYPSFLKFVEGHAYSRSLMISWNAGPYSGLHLLRIANATGDDQAETSELLGC